ncbi:MAG: integration host factor subunit beta [Gemmatimonadales bacterium]|nr:integration host factor subunit beta [Gemmatimonadales bacterium]
MTKAELVEIISEETGVNKKDTGVIVNLIMENIGQALVQGDKVELRGFGSFKVKTRRARLARNPRTGDSVDVPAKRVPFFKVSNELKARLNK